MRNYHIFISHAWNYSQHYKTIRQWLNATPYFRWSDYSVPVHDPLDVNTNYDLRARLRNQIAASSCVIVVSGMYSAYSKWIDYEIDTAVDLGKPIIGIRPWGQGRVPIKIQNNADVMIYWQSSSLINAIRMFAL